MIKQIQLRGISRSPSDRMTEDGGLDESLNLYLDNAESAPAFKPEDVTKKLGLPEAQFDFVFIHKTAQYEHVIVQDDENVCAYVKGARQEILYEEGLTVKDITSVGNTLIITTSTNMYYVLYNEKKYSVLGNKVYFPHINFVPGLVDGEYPVFTSKNDKASAWFETLPSEEGWNKKYNDDISNPRGGSAQDGGITSMLTEFWPMIEEKRAQLLEKYGWLCGTVFVRYAVELYDGTLFSSMPIMISPTSVNPLKTTITVKGSYYKDRDNNVFTSSVTNDIRTELSLYAIEAKMEDATEELLKWKDVIKSINIYISYPTLDQYKKDVSRLYNRKEVKTNVTDSTWDTTYTGDLFLGSKDDEENVEDALLRLSSMTYLVCEMDVDTSLNSSGIDGDPTMGIGTTIADLVKGKELDLRKLKEIQTYKLLNKDDMKHYTMFAQKLGTYNGKTILVQPSQVVAYDYNALNAYQKEENKDTGQQLDVWYQLDVTYLLKGVEEDLVVNAGPFLYKLDEYSNTAKAEIVYPFQIFPDARAYKMIVKRTFYQDTLYDGPLGVKYGEFEMKQHPYLDCAYYYGGLDKSLYSLCTLAEAKTSPANVLEEIDNKLIISAMENPFFFPIEGRYTFQSKIVGVAIASTALSQGQFGQFPLYVFTEDGIWVMETAADGSFTTNKPMSREVCLNPNSITSLGNAVVFVTDKGVMMLSGSQVVNISPFMNGKHYTINQSAKDILEMSDYASLLPSLTDTDTFMGFVKKAAVAYDYAGKRLIFIARDEAYQYVYKLDTQTWHKLKHEVELIEPINSYPECLVRGSDGYAHGVYDLSTILDGTREQSAEIGCLITRPLDLGYADVKKVIKDIRIRGEYAKGHLQYILQGSDDGVNYFNTKLKQKSWKLFRIIIVCALDRHERISWVDVDFDIRYNNKLR